jgi:hypothetical protein
MQMGEPPRSTISLQFAFYFTTNSPGAPAEQALRRKDFGELL